MQTFSNVIIAQAGLALYSKYTHYTHADFQRLSSVTLC
jgi:hypothetical protein